MTTRRAKATACLGWEMVWVEKQISPLRAARFGRNDLFGSLRENKQRQRQQQIPFGDDNKKSKGRSVRRPKNDERGLFNGG
jgi:hypothetical protein